MCLARFLCIPGVVYAMPSVEQGSTALHAGYGGAASEQCALVARFRFLHLYFVVDLLYSCDLLKWILSGLISTCNHPGFGEAPFPARVAGALWSGELTLPCGSLRLSSVPCSCLDTFPCLL